MCATPDQSIHIIYFFFLGGRENMTVPKDRPLIARVFYIGLEACLPTTVQVLCLSSAMHFHLVINVNLFCGESFDFGLPSPF